MKEPKFLFEINPPIAILLQVSERGREASAALFDERSSLVAVVASHMVERERGWVDIHIHTTHFQRRGGALRPIRPS